MKYVAYRQHFPLLFNGSCKIDFDVLCFEDNLYIVKIGLFHFILSSFLSLCIGTYFIKKYKKNGYPSENFISLENCIIPFFEQSCHEVHII